MDYMLGENSLSKADTAWNFGKGNPFGTFDFSSFPVYIVQEFSHAIYPSRQIVLKIV